MFRNISSFYDPSMIAEPTTNKMTLHLSDVVSSAFVAAVAIAAEKKACGRSIRLTHYNESWPCITHLDV